MKLGDLRRILSEFEIEWNESAGKGSHGAFYGLSHITRFRKVFPLPRDQQREISRIYLRALRKTFELTKEHGVSDDLFE